MNSGIIKRDTFTAIAAQVKKAQQDAITAIDMLDKTQKMLIGTLGAWRGSFLERSIDKEKCLSKIKGNAWSFLLERSGVFEFCSIKQRDEINKQMEDEKNLPEFTLENIQAWFESYAVNIDKLFEDSVKEVAHWLYPCRTEQEYKTNGKELIGRKVIKTCMFEQGWNSSINLRYSSEKYIQALDNIFFLMEGKGVAKYPGNLLTAIKAASQDHKKKCETEYFRVKWYKKGTMHLEFKRLDILEKVNKKAGGLNLSSDLFGKAQAMQKAG